MHLSIRCVCMYLCRRSVTKTETKILGLCGRELSVAGFDDLAKEAYQKMDDFANVLALHVKNQVRYPPPLSRSRPRSARAEPSPHPPPPPPPSWYYVSIFGVRLLSPTYDRHHRPSAHQSDCRGDRHHTQKGHVLYVTLQGCDVRSLSVLPESVLLLHNTNTWNYYLAFCGATKPELVSSGEAVGRARREVRRQRLLALRAVAARQGEVRRSS